jgi:pyrimidine-specific ribonucleoside hydrolase
MTDLLLDVDTGVDDALALLFALRHPSLRVRAITCVSGNAPLEQVLTNTLAVLDHVGAPDLPVAAGAHRPLIAPARHARHVHGVDGMGGLNLPRSTRRPQTQHAVQLLRDTINHSPEPITIVALGPLTNIALLLSTYPETLENVERIVVMGGSASAGNASPVAEFNVWHDPEAAAIVVNSDVPITMYGLDVFNKVTVGPIAIEQLTMNKDPGARLAGLLCQHQLDVASHDPRLDGGALIGDAGAVCAVADPAGLATEWLPVQVELAPGPSRGQTLVDRRPPNENQDPKQLGDSPRHIEVGLAVDAARYRNLFLTTLAALAVR